MKSRFVKVRVVMIEIKKATGKKRLRRCVTEQVVMAAEKTIKDAIAAMK